jgi:hypothetical protein
MIARLLLAFSVLMVIGGPVGSAQIEVYFDQSNTADTNVSFGATRPFIPVTRTIWVRNKSSIDIRIKPSFTDLNGQQSPVVSEFGGLLSNQVILAGQSKDYQVVYKADHVPFPVDVVASVRFVIDVEDAAAQKSILRQSFVLTGLKTNKLVGTDVTAIDFDSVYVEQSCADTLPVSVNSVTDATVPILEQRLFSGSTPGSESFTFRAYTDPVFVGVSAIVWKCVYRPVQVGPDSAVFSLLYKDIQNKNDSVSVKLRGTGVAQQFIAREVFAVNPLASSPTLRGDTIDLGDLSHLYDSVTVAIVIQNSGSIDVGLDSIDLLDAAQSKGVCSVVSGLKQRFQANARDTVLVKFVPQDIDGTTIYRLRLHTDLGRRKISCIPQWRIVREFVLRGRRKPPVLRADSAELKFGAVVKPLTCDVTTGQTLTLRNYSIDPCRIDSISIDPIGSGLAVRQRGPFLLLRDGSLIIDCDYSPVRTGNESGTITLWLATLQRKLVVPFSASVIDADTIQLSMPTDVRSAPGRSVVMPLKTNGNALRRSQRIVCRLEFNTSVLRLTDARTLGTAAEGALATLTETPTGAVVSFELQSGFAVRDTLANLQFATFLGDSSLSNVVIAPTTTAGTTLCESAFPIQAQHGRFVLDSLCGLSYKTIHASAGIRGGIFPNPTQSSAAAAILFNKAATASMMITDSFGRQLSFTTVYLEDGLTTIPLDVGGCSAGHYIVVVECEGFILRIPLLVQP